MQRITPEEVFHARRRFLQQALSLGLLSSGAALPFGSAFAASQTPLAEELTPESKATSYNNYYEFSSNKEAVKFIAKDLTLSPWSIECTGLCDKPTTFNVHSELTRFHEYIFRFRCVEGWSMVVPWNGFPLSDIIERVQPKAEAKFIKFTALYRPSEMIGQRSSAQLEWPYVEGLRIDEAMHPLCILATGMYGKALPPQNGGPIRLVVPWKYGYKSIKAITKIEFVAEQPVSSWEKRAPSEYGFYANVNPNVAHPRWSQRRELRLGEMKKQRTLLFNGYASQVESLYKDIDLEKNI